MFTDPIAQVVIKNPTSGKEWNWTTPDFPFLTGVSLLWEEKRTGNISINIEAPYEEGVARIMTPPTPFAIGNYIRARIGYGLGGFTDWAIGVLNAGGEGISIDANGVSGSVIFAGVSRSAHYTVSKDVKAVKSYTELLEKVALYLGLQLEIAPDAREVLVAMTKTPIDPSAFMSMSSLDIIKRICEWGNLTWVAGPRPYQMGGGVRWLTITRPREERKIASDVDDNKYVMRGIIDVANNQYPLMSWSPEGEAFATWLAHTPNPAGSGCGSPFVDTETGKVDWIEVLPKDMTEAIVGVLPESPPDDIDIPGEGVAADKKREGEAVAEVVGQPVKPGADGKQDAMSQIHSEVLAGSAAQRGIISTIGIPSEKCGNFCRVEGLGAVYDGPYRILKISHIWAGGSYDMSMTVQRFGVGGREKSTGKQEETVGGQE